MRRHVQLHASRWAQQVYGSPQWINVDERILENVLLHVCIVRPTHARSGEVRCFGSVFKYDQARTHGLLAHHHPNRHGPQAGPSNHAKLSWFIRFGISRAFTELAALAAVAPDKHCL